MDKQLACATYATLIPVFMLAGYFGTEGMRRARRIQVVPPMLAYLALAAIGEGFALAGIGTDTTTAEVVIAGAAAGVTAFLMFLAIAFTLLDQFSDDQPGTPAANPGAGDEEDSDKTTL